MRLSDEELVEAFQNGDSSAFDQLVSRWERKIQGAIYRIVGSGEDARDLCQEAFLKAYRGLGSFKREARFSSWLYQIAVNSCRDRMRRQRGKTTVSLDEMSETGELPFRGDGPSALELMEAGDLSRTVAAAVRSLPEEQREVIVLRHLVGLSPGEIAGRLGRTEPSIHGLHHRGRGALRTTLAERECAPAVRIKAAA